MADLLLNLAFLEHIRICCNSFFFFFFATGNVEDFEITATN